MPAPSRLILHQTNQVFLDDSRSHSSENARLAAREISAAAAVGAVAGVRAAINEDAQVSSETVAEATAAAASAAAGRDGQRDGGTEAVVVTVATAAAADAPPGRPAATADAINTVCNPKVPTGVMKRPQPNPCPWWSAMHQKFVEQIQVRNASHLCGVLRSASLDRFCGHTASGHSCLRVTDLDSGARHEPGKRDVQEADGGDGYEVIFYGDSLTEMWRGTRSDQPYPPRKRMPGQHPAGSD